MSNLPFVEEILADLRRFKECVEDGQDVDLGRDRFDLLTQLGLLNRTQHSPARWMMTQAGEDATTQPTAGEPVAYAAFADNGNIQMWCKAGIDVARIFASTGKSPVPLYTAPPAAAHEDEAVRAPEASAQDMANLNNFFMAVVQDSGHTVDKAGMRSLTELGALENCGFGKHRLTRFGEYLMEQDAAMRAQGEEGSRHD